MKAADRSRIRALASRQGGNVTRQQLLEAGIPAVSVHHLVERRDLIPVFTGIYAVGHVPREPGARAWAGLLAAGHGAAVAGRSAGYLLRVIAAWREPMEVVTDTHLRRRGLAINRTETLTRADIWVVSGLRVTSPARTALDLVARLSQKRRVRLINELRMEQRLTISALRDVAARNRRHPGAPIVLELIGDAQQQPTRSQLEDAFMAMITAHGLPVPAVNEVLGGHRVDAFFPEHGLVVELDGWATHGWKHAFEADRAAAVQVMALTGHPVLRLSYDQTTRHANRTAAQLRAVLAQTARS